MSVSCRSNAVKFVSRTARLLLSLAVLPAVALGPLSAEAILLHDHHGRDLHFHTVTLNDSKDHLKRWLCEHERDGRAVEPPREGCRTIVIALGLPDALMRVRGLSTGTPMYIGVTGPASAPRAVTATVDQDTGKPPLYERPWTYAPNPRTGSIVAGILLSNHALLL